MTSTPDRLPDRIQTPRLLLQRWQHDEARALSAAIAESVEHLRPFMSWIAFEPMTVAERVTLIEGWTRSWEDGGDVVYAIRFDGDVIGGCGLHRRVGPHALEIGYWIHPTHARHGYATELTAALTTAALAVDGIESVEVHTDEANHASAGVPAKLGFTRARVEPREPKAPAESGHFIIWTMTAHTWANRAGL